MISNKLRFNLGGIDVWLATLILLVALLPRVMGLGLFLTADEKNWIERSHAFVAAFVDGRFNDMLQTTHPGVTLLWVTGLSIYIQQAVSGIPYDGSLLIHFIKISQLPVAILNSLWVVGVFGLLRVVMEQVGSRLSLWWRRGWPALASIVIALDPFVIGYSRVVHVDALLTGFMILAALAIVMYAASGWSQRWLKVAAVLTALALLTKVPAVFLLPWWLLVVLVFGWQETISRQWFATRVRDGAKWLGFIVLIVVIVWPALIFVPDPKGNALLVKRDVAIAASTPHHMVEDYTLEGSHYLFTLLTRTTPVTFLFVIGVVITLGLVTWRQVKSDKKLRHNHLLLAWLVVAYAFFFVVMMTLGAKKGDRYILPVWPALDLLAAGGMVALSLWVERVFPAWKRKSSWFMTGVVGVGLLLLIGWYHPYSLAYHNPMFAPELSQSLGWGEGLNEAAAWIDSKDAKATVASWYPEELARFTKARVLHISQHEHPKVRYVVLYRNMLGRAEDHPATALVKEYLDQREPVHTIYIAGLPYVWIFERPAFERVVSELGPGKTVGQTLPVTYDAAAALDVLLATYNGQAKTGEVVVQLFAQRGEELLAEWRQAVNTLGDNEWLTLQLPAHVALPQGSLPYIEIMTQGTGSNKAPTVLYTSDYADSRRPMVVDGSERSGNLGVRWRYEKAGALLTEQDTLLLSN